MFTSYSQPYIIRTKADYFLLPYYSLWCAVIDNGLSASNARQGIAIFYFLNWYDDFNSFLMTWLGVKSFRNKNWKVRRPGAIRSEVSHGQATEEGCRTGYPLLRYGCQLRASALEHSSIWCNLKCLLYIYWKSKTSGFCIWCCTMDELYVHQI
jgi:hypothetical protein